MRDMYVFTYGVGPEQYRIVVTDNDDSAAFPLEMFEGLSCDEITAILFRAFDAAKDKISLF